MTEHNREPERQDAEPGSAGRPRPTAVDQEVAVPAGTGPAESAGLPEDTRPPEDARPPEDDLPEAYAGEAERPAAEHEAAPAGQRQGEEPGDRLVAGFAPPDRPGERQEAAAPVSFDKPAAPPAEGDYADQRQRPGFVPHNHDPRAPYGGWPGQGNHQPPGMPGGGGPMGPPPPGGPGRPMGPPPMGPGYGQPPNWSPVPPPPSGGRSGPGLGLFAVMALVVALVAGGVGAGIAVIASGGGDNGSVGFSPAGGGPAVQSRPPESVAGVAQKVLPSVVTVQVRGGSAEASGTGFIVEGGYVITNNHVVSSAAQGGQVEVVFNDKKRLPATIKGRDPSSDVAVLKPEGRHSLPQLEFGDSDKLAVGDPVIAIGSPLGLQGSVTTGIISSMNRPVPTRGEGGGDASVLNAIQTDAAINPGNSGGPLVDMKGRVVGINTAIATLGGQSMGGESQGGSIGLGFAIPINQGKRVAKEIINTGSAKRAQLGIGIDTRYTGPGVRITDQPNGGVQPIVKGGPADKAGLKPGDVITRLADQPIEDSADLLAQIRSRAPGQTVKVTYQRGGKETTVDVTLAAN
ncbi:S1C family serine protease [Spirillospora sp. NPDC050679]